MSAFTRWNLAFRRDARPGALVRRRGLRLEHLEDRHLLSASMVNHPPVLIAEMPNIPSDPATPLLAGSPDTTITLSSYFQDPDAGDTLSYSVLSPPSPKLVSLQVSQPSYTHIHQDLLYTHLGDNRGLLGDQHGPARSNIYNYFLNEGLTTTLEPFVYMGTTFYNVVGEKQGLTRPEDVYIVGAHYDSLYTPGADDNASGVAAIMEAARVLSDYDFDATLRFVAFDREEQGLVGSTAYAAAHANDHILGMLNVDMIGYNPTTSVRNRLRIYEAVDSGPVGEDDFPQQLRLAVPKYTSGISAYYSSINGASDHAPFEARGFDAAMLTEYTLSPYYHLQTDAVETADCMDYAFATKATTVVTGFLAECAGLVDQTTLVDASIVSGNRLRLVYAAEDEGTCEITVRAADQWGASCEATFTVTLSLPNHAPVLTPSQPALPGITEDDVASAGLTVAEMVGGTVTDADPGATLAVAIYQTAGSFGLWQYSLDAGASWSNMPAVSTTSALLLQSSNMLRYVPDGSQGDTATVSYYACDQSGDTAGLEGTAVNLSAYPYHLSGQFSQYTDTATLAVASVNDAPVLNASGNARLSDMAEDAYTSGNLVSELVASVLPLNMITDRDPGDPKGIAVVGLDNTAGSWQYNVNGFSWSPFGLVSETSARLLEPGARIRLVPILDFSGAITSAITFRAWDGSSGINGGLADTSSAGGISAFSAATETASINIWSVNDPPFRKAGQVNDLTVYGDSGLISLGLENLDYTAGGGVDEAGQSLTYLVTELPPAYLGQIVVPDGLNLVPVEAGKTYDLPSIRSMAFVPAADGRGGPFPFRFSVSDDGWTRGVPDPQTTIENLLITVRPALDEDTVALFDPATCLFYLRNQNSTGFAERSFAFGDPSRDCIPIAGDWDGDGQDGIALYDPAASAWYVRNETTTGAADVTFGFGIAGAGWIPLSGDWNGDGRDGIGLVDPQTGLWYLKDSLGPGFADYAFGFGAPTGGWTPVVGNWDGLGGESIGIYDQAAGAFYLRNSLATGMADVAFGFGAPGLGWKPLTGDWTAGGASGVGLYDPTRAIFYLRNTLDTGYADMSFGYGVTGEGWIPLVGRWRDNIPTGAKDVPARSGTGEWASELSRWLASSANADEDPAEGLPALATPAQLADEFFAAYGK